ncbi:hypothetical protein ACHWQZ_G007599 [Mnemiopsis leidyi]
MLMAIMSLLLGTQRVTGWDMLGVEVISGKCKVEEVNGFLKKRCHSGSDIDNSDSLSVYQCINSEEYYYAFPPLNIGGRTNEPILNATCSEDTYGYQVCGMAVTTSTIKFSTSWSICGHLYCHRGKTIDSFGREELCSKSCENLKQEQIENLKCCNLNDVENTTEICDEPDEGEMNKKCNLACDERNCQDESECNGYAYGMFCNFGSGTGRFNKYVPVYEVCDGSFECTGYLDEDAIGCNQIHPADVPSCISGELVRKSINLKVKNRIRIPIFNFTRCAAMEESVDSNYNRYSQTPSKYGLIEQTGIPYCLDYMDQTNCSDPVRVGVICPIKEYGISNVSKTMVCGRYKAGLCMDGMDLECVDVDRSCTVHKHQLCDGVPDCERGADEYHSDCHVLTSETCFRKFYTGRPLQIPLSWLGDGVLDCLSGLDEDWGIECGRSTLTRRFEVSSDCKEVFMCPQGTTSKFIRFTKLCNGIEKCGNENLLCETGRGLSSANTAIQVVENNKFLQHCLKGLEELKSQLISPCISQEFNPFNEDVFGIDRRTVVTLSSKEMDCSFVYGEALVTLSCLGKCKNFKCPLTRPVTFRDCPIQYSDRIYTLVNGNRLTFVTRQPINGYHNNYFLCNNGICTDYEKVCNLWDDCGDGSDEELCPGSFHCNDKQGYLPLSKKCDGNPDCGDMSDECNNECSKEIINLVGLKIAAWVLGLLAVVSNLVVLYENGRSLTECKSADIIINKLLIMLIGVGDFTVGLYLLVIAIADFGYGEKYCKQQFEWLTSLKCSVLGVISTFGSLVSLFSLTILSALRVIKIYFGAVRQRGENESISRTKKMKIAPIIVSIILLAVFIAVVSLLPFLDDFFVNGLVYDKSIKVFYGQIDKEKHFNAIQSYYGRSKSRILKWKVIDSLVRSMFSRDYENLDGKIKRVDFYGNDGVCLFKYFVTRKDSQWTFVISILVMNIVCFAVISTAYIYINAVTFKSSRALTREAGPTADMVNKRNRKLQRKVATIIMTDFLCLAPFILTSLLHFFEVIDATAYYGYFSIVALPINSVINPFLYSEMMWNLVSKIKKISSAYMIRMNILLRGSVGDATRAMQSQLRTGKQDIIIKQNVEENIEIINVGIAEQQEDQQDFAEAKL